MKGVKSQTLSAQFKLVMLMKQDKLLDSFQGHHCLVAVNDDGTRMTGLKLESSTFQRIARLVVEDADEIANLSNVEVKMVKPQDFTPSMSLWHVRARNAIFNIHHRHVEFYFDVPIPIGEKDDRERSSQKSH